MDAHGQRRLDRQNRRFIATLIVFPLMGAPAAMAEGSVGEVRVSSAQPGQNIGPLLLKLEHQIEAEHVALPKSDNASETWLLVIAKAYPTTPEIRLALANFAAHAHDRATTERAAGKDMAATEFQVFGELASDMLKTKDGALTTSSGGPSASYSAGAPQVSSRSASLTTDSARSLARLSDDTASSPEAVQLNRANEPLRAVRPAAPEMSSSADASSANATRPPAPPPHSLTTGSARSLARLSVDTASPPAVQPNRANEPALTDRPVAPKMSSSTDASSANATRPSAPTSHAALTVAPRPSSPSAILNSAPAAPGRGNVAHPTVHVVQRALAAASPAAVPITPLPTMQGQSLIALYVTRGDQMLAIKDVSAARKLYEYAANAGSARAATALARTFDPSFLTRLGVIGLKSDPALAAVWYGKAAALGDRTAETLLGNLKTAAAK